mmetsp:Transcript_9587/g.28989  ORF Transcript_9587/g.28989 Transcript_9587/m.28989 type:complete len:257 (-) Transcript_9587:1433-2203(-)
MHLTQTELSFHVLIEKRTKRFITRIHTRWLRSAPDSVIIRLLRDLFCFHRGDQRGLLVLIGNERSATHRSATHHSAAHHSIHVSVVLHVWVDCDDRHVVVTRVVCGVRHLTLISSGRIHALVCHLLLLLLLHSHPGLRLIHAVHSTLVVLRIATCGPLLHPRLHRPNALRVRVVRRLRPHLWSCSRRMAASRLRLLCRNAQKLLHWIESRLGVSMALCRRTLRHRIHHGLCWNATCSITSSYRIILLLRRLRARRR